MSELYEMTIVEAAEAIRTENMSPVDLMECLLRRSRDMDSHLRVWETLDEELALDSARARQLEIERNGPQGALHGIPIGVKDIFNTKNLRTTSGSPIYENFVPDFDSTAVGLLRKAGAIVMGKTITTEFASFDPPPTRNPWNHEHTPGGSSSGSAVGVAARMFPAALGSQTSGSVLRPASYTGVIGVKPTFGRISRYGVTPVASSLDTIGYFTRSVEDAALVLEVISGHDKNDPESSREPVDGYTEAVASVGLAPRIGIVRGFFSNMADDEVSTHTENVVDNLAFAGADIEEAVLISDFDTLLEAHRVVMNVESAVSREKEFASRPDDFSPNIRGSIESGMSASGTGYVKAQQTRASFRREITELAGRFDILLTPSTLTQAPRDLTTTGDPSFQAPWTTAGLPTISIPSGLTKAGLPLGIQLAASPFAEARLLSSALWCVNSLDVSLGTPTDV